MFIQQELAQELYDGLKRKRTFILKARGDGAEENLPEIHLF